jgi:uncharacterized protein (TIGR02452 family)
MEDNTLKGILVTDYVEQTPQGTVWNGNQWQNDFCKAINSGDYSLARQLRIEVFKSTLQAVKEGAYTLQNGKVVSLPLSDKVTGSSKFYRHEFNPTVKYEQRYDTQITVVNGDCLEYAHIVSEVEDDVCVLNMASRRNPGGGVLNGAGAQEEYLFRCSDYYRSLYRYASYAHDYGLSQSHYHYPLDRDFGGIFSPDVTIFRSTEENGYEFIEQPWKMNFIAVSGMNRPETTISDGEERIDWKLIPGIKNKMRTIFHIAIDNGMRVLLLGALGCGAFKNPPKHTAELFKEVLSEPEFKNVFKRVIFVIKDDHNSSSNGNFASFSAVFGETSFFEMLPSVLVLLTIPTIVKDPTMENSVASHGKCLHVEHFSLGLKWALYTDASLVISGYGEIPDYVNHWDSYFGNDQAPWVGCDKYGIMPNRLIVMDGITRIGDNAFESFGCLKEVIISDSVKSIGNMAFFDCFNIIRMKLPRHYNLRKLGNAELPMFYNAEYSYDSVNHVIFKPQG